MSCSEEKKLKIKESLAKTREKRLSQVCKVYTLKIDFSHCNNQQRTFLKHIFIEAKWFYNHPRKTTSFRAWIQGAKKF